MKKLNQFGELAEVLLVILTVVGVIIAVLACFTIIPRLVKDQNARQTARGRGDAPTGNVNTEKRDVYQMPDAFSNVAVVCDSHGNAIYVTTKTDQSRGLFALKDGCK